MQTRKRDLLTACRLAEKAASRETKWRPAFHLSPPAGWMNDPNGLCWFQGRYHIFYQYAPFGTQPGLNFWGHVSTADLVEYACHPPALCCDESFDCHGVYSGSAVVMGDILHLYYTGNVKHAGAHDYVHTGRDHHTVHAESTDGVHFENKRVVLSHADYPADVTRHVRDPKVFYDDGTLVMLLGARRQDGRGEVLVYTGETPDIWKFSGAVTSEEKLGYMWECPDGFSMGGQYFLSFCPQGMEADGILYQNLYQSGYAPLSGRFTENPHIGEFTEWDRGFDFYAPQTFLDAKGRRILVGWAGMPDLDPSCNPTHSMGWVHLLTMPRCITCEEGRLLQNPLPELEALRLAPRTEDIQGRSWIRTPEVFEAWLEITSGPSGEVLIRDSCRLSWQNGFLTMEFVKNGYGRGSRTAEIPVLKRLRIFSDTSILEVFVNNGEAVFTSRFYPDAEDEGLEISGCTGTVTLWGLRKFSCGREHI